MSEEARKPLELVVPSTGEIVKIDDVLMPIADTSKLVQAIKAYEATRAALISEGDIVEYQGKKAPTKSFFIKMCMAYGVSTHLKDGYPKIERDKWGNPVGAECVCYAVAPNGRITEGWGACAVEESRYKRESARQKLMHDLGSTAETRAKNRAAINMFGWSGTDQISYEEMKGTPEEGDESDDRESSNNTPVSRMAELETALRELAAARLGSADRWKEEGKIGKSMLGLKGGKSTPAETKALTEWAKTQLSIHRSNQKPDADVIDGEVVEQTSSSTEESLPF